MPSSPWSDLGIGDIVERSMPALKKRKTYSDKCPVCGGDIHPLGDETIYFDELAPNVPVLAEVSPGHWVKVIERKPAKT